MKIGQIDSQPTSAHSQRILTGQAAFKATAMAELTETQRFPELVSVIKALFAEFQKRDELETLAAVKTVVADIQATCSQQNEAVKTLIRGKRVAIYMRLWP